MNIETFAPNHFVVKTDKGTFFQSYNSVIIFIDNMGEVTLGKDYDYSSTTSKYRNQFLGVDSKTFKKNLSSGIYQIDFNLKIQ